MPTHTLLSTPFKSLLSPQIHDAPHSPLFQIHNNRHLVRLKPLPPPSLQIHNQDPSLSLSQSTTTHLPQSTTTIPSLEPSIFVSFTAHHHPSSIVNYNKYYQLLLHWTIIFDTKVNLEFRRRSFTYDKAAVSIHEAVGL